MEVPDLDVLTLLFGKIWKPKTGDCNLYES
jgi:hypothetical protein